MKRLLTIILVLAAVTIGAHAQSYKSAVGLRGGDPSGITFKTFISGSNAIELVAGSRFGWDNIVITGFYEYEQPTGWAPNLDWYFGIGAHLGFWDNDASVEYDSNIMAGVDGIVGLEYTFDDIPLNLSLDIVPSFNIIGHPSWFHMNGGISIRYVF